MPTLLQLPLGASDVCIYRVYNTEIAVGIFKACEL